jgi:hypothetical protein
MPRNSVWSARISVTRLTSTFCHEEFIISSADGQEVGMPVRLGLNTGYQYYLIDIDADGVEKADADGVARPGTTTKLLSQRVVDLVRDRGTTDLFLCAHGWGQDLAAAAPKYDEWVGLMVTQGLQSQDADRRLLAGDDVEQAQAEDPDFRSAAVALHWPSNALDDELAGTLAAGPFAPGPGLATSDPAARDALAARLAAPIPGGEKTRDAIKQIMDSADQIATSPAAAVGLLGGRLPDHLQTAYQALYDASGLADTTQGETPGETPPPDFGPVVRKSVRLAAYASARKSAARPSPSRHGIVGELEDVIADIEAAAKVVLTQLRAAFQGADAIADKVWGVALLVVSQLSFWSMKDRAQQIGAKFGHPFLNNLLAASPNLLVHLMGHSFGCILASAAVRGPVPSDGTECALDRHQVGAVYLVQGAMSVWSYSKHFPFNRAQAGYLWPAQQRIHGPLVTTQSRWDRANGFWYPLATTLESPNVIPAPARHRMLRRPAAAGATTSDLLDYGAAVGAHGLLETVPAAIPLPAMKPASNLPDPEYGLRAGGIYNMDASAVIRDTSNPWMGAHSDILHEEVAELFWQAVLAATGP